MWRGRLASEAVSAQVTEEMLAQVFSECGAILDVRSKLLAWTRVMKPLNGQPLIVFQRRKPQSDGLSFAAR